MRKLFKKLHLWLSLPFGLIISTICISGASLVFEQEIMELIRPHLYFVKSEGKDKISINNLIPIITNNLPDSTKIASIEIHRKDGRSYKVNLTKPRRTAIYVNPYNGKILGDNERGAFFSFMFRLHRWLLDASTSNGSINWGKLIVGISTIIFIIISITGIVIWFPRCNFKVNIKRGFRRFCYDSHISTGAISLLIILLMAFTGLTWSFQWYRTGIYSLFGASQNNQGEAPSSNEQKRSEKQENLEENFISWDKAIESVKTVVPELSKLTISKGSIAVNYNRFGNARASDTYKFNTKTGEITQTILYEDSPKATKLRGIIYSLHVGNWGGILTRILQFLAALIGGILPISGYYIWIRKKL